MHVAVRFKLDRDSLLWFVFGVSLKMWFVTAPNSGFSVTYVVSLAASD